MRLQAQSLYAMERLEEKRHTRRAAEMEADRSPVKLAFATTTTKTSK
jgi:hypothetical protein